MLLKAKYKMENRRQWLLFHHKVLTAAEGQINIMYQIPILCILPTGKIGSLSSLLVKLLTGVETQKKTRDHSLFRNEG
jgi:hypothetical protein